jgi:hypothetical protein
MPMRSVPLRIQRRLGVVITATSGWSQANTEPGERAYAGGRQCEPRTHSAGASQPPTTHPRRQLNLCSVSTSRLLPFTVLVLPLTIFDISHSIRHLKGYSQPTQGSVA